MLVTAAYQSTDSNDREYSFTTSASGPGLQATQEFSAPIEMSIDTQVDNFAKSKKGKSKDVDGAEHTAGARKSTKNKHQKGQTTKQQKNREKKRQKNRKRGKKWKPRN